MPHTEYSVEKINRAGRVSRVWVDAPKAGKTSEVTDSLSLAEQAISERLKITTGYRYRLVTTTYGDWEGEE